MGGINSVFEFFGKATLRTWIVLGILLLSIGIFLELTSELHESGLEGDSELTQLDHGLMNFVAQFRHNSINGAMLDLTALGSTLVLTFLVALFIILMLLKGQKGAALYMLIAGLGSAVLTRGLKALIGRERPSVVERLVDVQGFSYPSGHSLSSAAIYLSFALLACGYYKGKGQRTVIFVIASLLIFGVAFSRVFLGVHYPTDVAGGVCIGVAWAFLLGGVSPLVANWWRERKNHKI